MRQDGVGQAAVPEHDSPGGPPGYFKCLRRLPETTVWLPEIYLVVIKLLPRHNSAAIGVYTEYLLEYFDMRFARSLSRDFLRAAAVASLGLVISTAAARADWHGGGHGGGGWHGGGGGWNGGGWHGGGWGWHGGTWGCCWRGGVFIGVPSIYVPPPIYYPPPPVYYPPPAYYPPPYGYAVPGY
jgi:hypothetical protein